MYRKNIVVGIKTMKLELNSEIVKLQNLESELCVTAEGLSLINTDISFASLVMQQINLDSQIDLEVI